MVFLYVCRLRLQGTDTTGAGLVSRLAWLRERGCMPGWSRYPLAETVCVAGDEPEALAVLLSAQPSREELRACAEAAARHGRTACLQLLLQRGGLAPSCVHLGGLLFMTAYTLGKPPQLQTAVWLVEHLTGEGVPEAQRHPLTARVFTEASRFGDLPLLQLLRQRGCPWDTWDGPEAWQRPHTAWEGAAQGGCEAVLEWLQEACCPKRVRKERGS